MRREKDKCPDANREFFTRRSMARRLVALASLCCLLSGWSYAYNLGNFNRFPKVPYELTSPEQDELVATARKLIGDSKEEAGLSACQALLSDGSVRLSLGCHHETRCIPLSMNNVILNSIKRDRLIDFSLTRRTR